MRSSGESESGRCLPYRFGGISANFYAKDGRARKAAGRKELCGGQVCANSARVEDGRRVPKGREVSVNSLVRIFVQSRPDVCERTPCSPWTSSVALPIAKRVVQPAHPLDIRSIFPLVISSRSPFRLLAARVSPHTIYKPTFATPLRSPCSILLLGLSSDGLSQRFFQCVSWPYHFHNIN